MNCNDSRNIARIRRNLIESQSFRNIAVNTILELAVHTVSIDRIQLRIRMSHTYDTSSVSAP